MDNTKSRMPWLDIAKGIGIILVVLGHTGLPEFSRKWIFSFHMPLFFFISGVLYNDLKYERFIAIIMSRIRTIMLPYFSFLFIIFAWSKVLNYKAFSVGTKELLTGSNSALWFLPVLFATELFWWAACRISPKKIPYRLSISFGSLLIAGIAQNLEWHIWYKLEVCFYAIAYYGVGHALKETIVGAKIFNKKLWDVCTILLLLATTIIFTYLLPKIDMRINSIGLLLPNYFLALLGIALIIYLAKLLKNNNILAHYGNGSIVVLGMHQSLYITLKRFTTTFHWPSRIDFFVRQTLLWVSLYLLIALINSYFPALIGRKKRG